MRLLRVAGNLRDVARELEYAVHSITIEAHSFCGRAPTEAARLQVLTRGGDTGGAAGPPATGQGGGNDEGATDGDGEAGKAGADADMGEAETDVDMGEAEADADASGTLSFAEPVIYPGGAWAMDIGVADLNGDGALDVASADFSNVTGGVFVWLNQGDGSFAAASPYLLGEHGVSIEVADINGDKKLDLITATEDSLSALLNNGDGTFCPRVGRESSAAVLFNQGDGTFSKPDLYAAGSWPTSVALGDLDADGWPELVVANSGVATPGSSRSCLAVYRNLGDGTFAPPEEFEEVGHPYAVMLADLNGDGKLDITAGDAGGSLAVVLNTTR